MTRPTISPAPPRSSTARRGSSAGPIDVDAVDARACARPGELSRGAPPAEAAIAVAAGWTPGAYGALARGTPNEPFVWPRSPGEPLLVDEALDQLSGPPARRR